MTGLVDDFPMYLNLAQQASVGDVDLWDWWVRHRRHLPCYFAAAKKVALIQPSSAPCERAFSIFRNHFSNLQRSMLEDGIEAGVMLAYNNRADNATAVCV